MHGKLVPAEDVDDFIILRMRAFTSETRQIVTQRVLTAEGLALLEWQVMFSVARFGTCHLAHITRHTSIDPAHGSRAATALEKRKLISRIDDPKNRRRKLISLTPEGVKTFKRVWPRAQHVIRMVEKDFTPQEFEEFKRLLDKANQAVENMMENLDTKEKDDAHKPSQMQRKIA